MYFLKTPYFYNSINEKTVKHDLFKVWDQYDGKILNKGKSLFNEHINRRNFVFYNDIIFMFKISVREKTQ